MADEVESLRRAIEDANRAALEVHDSPVRADKVFNQVKEIASKLPSAALGEEKSARVAAALDNALRLLRRDDDGREASRHLQSALRLFESRPRSPSPFLDD